jgi:hypothetical protein
MVHQVVRLEPLLIGGLPLEYGKNRYQREVE